MWESKRVLVLGILFLCARILPKALAEDDTDEWVGYTPQDMYDPEEFTGLTGDWQGQRRKLADKGITIDIDVIQFYQGVLDGGTDSTWKYGGTGEYNFQFDFQKLGLWPDAFVDIRAKHQFGQFVNTATGGIVPANTQGILPSPDYDGVALPKVVFTQFLSESLAVYLGKIDTIEVDSTRFSGARGKDIIDGGDNDTFGIGYYYMELSDEFPKIMAPYLKGRTNFIRDDSEAVGWEQFSRAIRQGRWKATWIMSPFGTDDWQLFDLANDISERNDLAETNPEKLNELILLWEEYADEVGVVLPSTTIQLAD